MYIRLQFQEKLWSLDGFKSNVGFWWCLLKRFLLNHCLSIKALDVGSIQVFGIVSTLSWTLKWFRPILEKFKFLPKNFQHFSFIMVESFSTFFIRPVGFWGGGSGQKSGPFGSNLPPLTKPHFTLILWQKLTFCLMGAAYPTHPLATGLLFTFLLQRLQHVKILASQRINFSDKLKIYIPLNWHPHTLSFDYMWVFTFLTARFAELESLKRHHSMTNTLKCNWYPGISWRMWSFIFHFIHTTLLTHTLFLDPNRVFHFFTTWSSEFESLKCHNGMTYTPKRNRYPRIPSFGAGSRRTWALFFHFINATLLAGTHHVFQVFFTFYEILFQICRGSSHWSRHYLVKIANHKYVKLLQSCCTLIDQDILSNNSKPYSVQNLFQSCRSLKTIP